MTEFFSALSQPFMQRALIVGVLISVCAALLGVVLVLKRYALIGHGLADIGFASLSLAIAMGWSPLYVSMPIVAVASFAIMLISQKSGSGGDTAIGVVSTASLAGGIIITHLAGGMNVDVYSYMFGSILGTTDSDLYLSIPLAIIVIVSFILLYNRLFMVTYDETYAKACGINVTLYQFFISFLTAVTVVIGMRMMGTLLIASLIIFPALISKRLVRSFKSVVIISSVVSVTCFLIGMVISYFLDLPVGASIVAVNMAFLAIASLMCKLKITKI